MISNTDQVGSQAGNQATDIALLIRPKTSRDDKIMIGYMLVIGLYLVIALALPLYAMLSKSVSTFRFELHNFAFQVHNGQVNNGQVGGDGWSAPVTAFTLNQEVQAVQPEQLITNSDGRLVASGFFPEFSFRSPSRYKIRQINSGSAFLFGSTRIVDTEWHEYSSNEFRSIVLRPTRSTGLDNYRIYFSTPTLFRSIKNSLVVSLISTLITVSLAFGFAYALARSTMRFKGLFRVIAMAPILVPSLLPGIALVYLFGNQGMLKALLLGESIYGPIGIVIGSVFFTFPHAMIIITTALAVSDARLYEVAVSLRASHWKTFWTVTIPAARYGLISAAFVVFNLVITDFGLPKVIGGQYNMLAVDIYTQVIGQQNFEMGAVVSMVLLVPALLAFSIDRIVQKKQVAQISARSVPFEPKPHRQFDLLCFSYCVLITIFIAGLISICQYAALIKFWPYNLTLDLHNYNFDVMDGGGWDSYANSIRLAFYTAVVGTVVVFCGAYMVEKTNRFFVACSAFQFLAMLPMAIPGMVLGLAYIFFFNNPANPLHGIYATMGILVVCTVTHFYTVSHLTAITALKQIDREFESVAGSLKQPFHKLLSKVTLPICLPSVLDISIYLFVNAMTTVSAVIFLYSPDTTLASVAVLNMDDAGDIAAAAAMGMMIFYANVCARLIHLFITRKVLRKTQAWRNQTQLMEN